MTRHALPTRRTALWVPILLIASTLAPRPVVAQNSHTARFFPTAKHFERPQAAPREPTFALRALWSDLFASTDSARERGPFAFEETPEDMATDVQGEAVLGGSVRIWQPATWTDGGVTLGIASAVFGRFRLEVSSSDLVATDWVVALPIEARRGPWSARLQWMHWSAHIGDELVETTGAERIDFTHNGTALLLARDVGDWRLYGGGALLGASSLENEEQLPEDFSDAASVQFGADGAWAPDGARWAFEAAVDWQAAARTEWSAQWSALAGVRMGAGARSAQLRAFLLDGPSHVGQFFWTDERAWGLELVIEL